VKKALSLKLFPENIREEKPGKQKPETIRVEKRKY
jgi:hypothetical protein